MKHYTANHCSANKPLNSWMGSWVAKLGVVATMLISGAAYAGVKVNVTTTADEFGAGSGCSLREALYTIYHASAFGGCVRTSGFLFDYISIPAGTYAIALPPNGGNLEAGGAFKVYAAVSISGAGPGKTIIDGTSIDSVFSVNSPAGQSAFLSGMTIRGGLSGAGSGAGIDHGRGTLSVQNVVVTANFGGYGISSHETEGLTLLQVTVSDNQNTGVYVSNYYSASATTLIENTTISGNVSPTNAGGIEIYAANNRTDSATISNSTIAYNTGRADGQNVRSPGGLAIYGTGVSLYLRNTILARNLRGDRRPEDCDATVQINSQGYNLIEQSPFCVFQGNTATDIHGIDPQLEPLFDYGGGIPTHAAFPGSSALNGGNPSAPGSGGAACAAVDARGIDRTQNTPCDIGAYEYHADYTVQSTADASDDNVGDGLCHTNTPSHFCTLRAAIDEANAASAPVTIFIGAGHYTITKPPVSSFLDNIDGDFVLRNLYPVAIVGAGADQTIVDAGQLDRIMSLGSFNFAPVALHGMTLSNGIGAFGGALQIFQGSALIDRVRITGNIGAQGNGVWLSGQGNLSVIDSTIDSNTANGTGGEGGGGGIFAATGAQLTLRNTTISDNFSHASGGGIFNDGGTVSIAFSTIANNRQFFNNLNGGGVASGMNGGTWHVTDSIIANNKTLQGPSLLDSDCAATLQLAGKTLVRTATNCTFAGPAGNAITGVDPLLSPLLQQGGPTPTVAPLAASPVHTVLTQRKDCVDIAGNQVLTDQRGMPRPTYAWGSPEYCDLGAFQGNSDVIFADGFE